MMQKRQVAAHNVKQEELHPQAGSENSNNKMVKAR
jgi:hypothetical protein